MTTATDPLDRVLNRVTPGHGGCWVWTGKELTPDGYGRVYVQAGDGRMRRVMIHRLVHERLVGPIPEGWTVDHTCHNASATCSGGPCFHRRCVNPAHLQAATLVDNAQRSPWCNGRKAECPQGHRYTTANTVINSVTGNRMCRECRQADGEARRRRAGARKRSKTHCIRDHDLTPENTYQRADGGRQCRACALARAKRRS